MQFAIVIPTYNERSNIVKLVPQIRAAIEQLHGSQERKSANLPWNVHIIVVDDNSSDGTADAVRLLSREDANLHLISRPGKMGLGSAYLDAFRWITNNFDASVIVQMDADLSHPPSLLGKMMKLVAEGQADVAIASRYLEHGGTENWPAHRKIISKGANFLARFFLNIDVNDITSGYRAYSASCVREMLASNLSSSGYEYQIEALYVLARLRKRMVEVPFIFANRADGKSKLGMKDMMHFASEVVNLWLHPKVRDQEKARRREVQTQWQ